MYLVGIHAQVTSSAESLLDRILNALVNDLAEEALRCFRQVKRFGMGGMLRVCVLSISTTTHLDGCLRQLLRSSSCIRRSAATSRHLRQRHCQNYITKFRKPIHDGLETRICKAT